LATKAETRLAVLDAAVAVDSRGIGVCTAEEAFLPNELGRALSCVYRVNPLAGD
jgi:hypothetical protein